MAEPLHPSEFATDSAESHFARFSRGRRTVYRSVWVLVLCCLGALPLVKVDLAVRSAGIVRPATEKTEVRAAASGALQEVAIRQGQRVARGQVLAVVGAPEVATRLALLESQVRDREAQIADLRRLTAAAASTTLATPLRVPERRREYAQFRADLSAAQLQEERLGRDLGRVRALHARTMASDSELEDLVLQAEQAGARTRSLVEQYAGGWSQDLATLEHEVRALRSEMSGFRAQRAMHTVTAPQAGTVEEAVSLSPGSFVQAGDRLAVISPEATMIAEFHVPPGDVGLLRPGMPVRIQVDAFNYMDWGVLTGRVTEVSDDFLLVGGQPTFRVRCALDGDRLRLRNGVAGRLKKGMTLQGRFMVARRSLFALLHENVNDWLNPMHPSAPAA